jgi:hypothetical protein
MTHASMSSDEAMRAIAYAARQGTSVQEMHQNLRRAAQILLSDPQGRACLYLACKRLERGFRWRQPRAFSRPLLGHRWKVQQL